VLQPEHLPLLKQRNIIRLSMPPPLLVVEIVSPGELQRNRDYVAKRSQYGDRGIPEYWIVDPQQRPILILTLVNGVYTETATLRGKQAIASDQVGSLNLTVAEVFGAT
jgi:Uma2 family endonuclease